MFSESIELNFIDFKHTFSNKNLWIKRSYKICYEVKVDSLDWASYALPLKPGRAFILHLPGPIWVTI